MTTNTSGAPLALEEDSALEVPEEPEKEEDDQDDMPKDSESESSSGSLLNFLTAVRIARWMARAYGYVARKKKNYVSQDRQATSARLSSDELLDVGSGGRHLAESRRNSFFEVEITKDEESNVPREVGMSELSGDESQDAATVCRWFASSYGETNKEYHEAYSREILRQIKEQSTGIDANGHILKKPAAWF